MSKKFFAQILLYLFLCGAPFWILEDGGFVALLEEETGILHRSDTPLSALPKQEASVIQDKIPCYSAEEAARYMENFCS